MLKRAKIAAVGLAFLALFGFLVFQAGLASHHTTAQQQPAATHREQKTILERYWEWTTEDPVAVYTLVLAVSTILLWIATCALYFAGKRQIEAALQAQRPYMSYEMFLRRLDAPQELISENSIPEECLLDVRFENHGEMAALIYGVQLGYMVAIALPQDRANAETHDTFPERALLIRGRPRSIQREGYTVTLNEEQRCEIREGKKFLWIYGNFLFDNNVSADDDGPYDFFFARKYVFYRLGRKSAGFTHEGVPKQYMSR
jgi:hypothetical protein